MKNFLRSLYLLCLVFLSTATVNQTCAQLVITAPPPGPNYTQLVQQFFVGGGVTVSNVTYTGAANAVGSFTANGTNLGLPGGIILSTGNRNNAIGPNNQPNAGSNLGLNGFAQLNGLAGATTYDGTMLQFDFVAQSSSVTFQYVFASEEYPEYVNQGFNDAFAFFIQGPGFPLWSNIALVPNTTTPITIDNVNDNSYSQYYVNNSNGQTIEFDGFTTTMTATAVVVPCQTYTLRLMIADGGDHIFDSAVFLGQNSLSSNAVTVSAGSGYSGSTNSAYEGCLPGYLNFSIPQAQGTDFTFNYTIGGTAQNGVDYQTIPTSVTIPAGQTSAQIVINAINDGNTEGQETIDITVNNLCSTSTTTVYVNDVAPLTINAGADQTICSNNPTAALNASATGGLTPYVYSWSNGVTTIGNTASINVVPPFGQTTYTATVTGACPGQTATDQVVVTANQLPSAAFTVSSATACTGTNATITYTGVPISGQTYNWNFNGGTIVSGSGAGPYQISWGTAGTKTISLTVTNNGCPVTTTNNIVINTTPTAAYTTSASSVCAGQTVTASATPVTGGIYNWSVNNGASISGSGVGPVTVNYPGPGTYTVSLNVVAGGCTSANTATNIITVKPQPTATFTAATPLCTGVNGAINYTGNGLSGATYTWGFNGGTVASGSGQGPYQVNWASAGAKTVSLTVDLNGCQASSTMPVTVNQTPTAAFTVSSATICDGQAASATATPVTGGTYNWSVNNGATITGSGVGPVTINYPAPGTYTVSLSTVANGCTSANTATNTITVKPQPTATFTAATPLCTGANGAIAYTGNNLTGATYTWGFNGGTIASGSGQGPYQVNWASAGAKTVSLTVALNGCSASSTMPVTVNQTPTAAFTATSPLCTGVNGIVTYSGTPVTGSTYNWNFDGANIVSGTNQGPYTLNWSTASVKNITLTVTTPQGCSATSATVPVTVKQTPSSTFTADSPLCLGEDGTITYTGTPLTGAAYTWNFNGGTTVSGSGVGPYEVHWNTAGTKNVTLSITANGCSSGITTIPVVVNAAPTTPFVISSSTICDGQPLTATYAGNGTGGATYNWSINNGGTVVGSGVGPITFTYPGPGTYIVSLIVTQNGCASAANNVTVTVKPRPTSAFTTTTPLCTGTTGTIALVGTPATGATYLWGFNGGTVASGTGAGPYQVSWNTAGTKNVSLTVTLNGCSSPASSQQVVVNQTPSAACTAPATLCSGVNGTVNYTGTQLNGATYTWNFSGADVVSGSGAGPYQLNWATGGAKTVSLSVSANGCTNTNQATVNVNTTPVSSFTVSNTQFCTGANATVTYSGTPVTGAVYTWNFNGGTVVSGSGAGPYQISWSTPGTKNITLSIAANGCNSGITTVPVIINSIPTSTFTASGTSVCDGTPVNLTYTGTGLPGATYTWSSTNGATISGSSNPYSLDYPAPGSYNVSLVVTQNGCTSPTTNVAVTVKPMPVSDFTVSNTQFCTGANATVTYAGTPITGATYAWNFNGGTVVSGSGAGPYQISWTTGGTKNVTLTVTANGCVSTTTTVPVIVNSVPTSTFTASGTSVCDGTPVNLTYTGTGLPNATYTWSSTNNATVVGSSNPYSLNYPASGSYNVSLVVSQNGCTSPTTNVAVTVKPMPTSPFTVSNTQFCTGANATVTYNGAIITGATYAWNFNGGTVVSGSGAGPYQISWPTAGSKTISLTVSANGCVSVPTLQVVTIYPVPTASFTTSSPSVCDGAPVSLNYTGTASPNATYTWSATNGADVSGTPGSFTFNYPGPGSYSASLTVSENGCSSNTITAPITVYPIPSSDFTVSNNQFCTGASAIVTYTGTTISGATYNWNFNGATVANGSGAGPYNISWPTAGTKNITLTVTANGCPSATTTIPVVVNAIPTATFVTSGNSVCDSLPVSITYNGTGSPNATFNWTVSGGASISGSGNGPFSLNYPGPGSYNISLVVVENACSSSPSQQTVVVKPIPTASFTANSPLCTNDINNIVYTGNGLTGATYQWNFDGGTVVSGSGQGPYNVKWLTGGTKNVQLTLIQNGCASPSYSVPVVVNDRPTSTFSVSSSTACNGQPVSLTYTGSGSQSSILTWSASGGATVTNNIGQFGLSYPGPGTYNVTLTVTDNGCASTNSTTLPVIINQMPTSAFVASGSPICTGQPLSLTYTGNAPVGASYNWNAPGLTITSTGGGNYGVSYTNPGTYTIELTVIQNGCTSATTSIPVVINQTPSSAFVLSSNSVCNGHPLFVEYSGNASNTATYNWSATNGATIIPTGNDTFDITYPGIGTYTVSLSVTDNGCTSPTATTGTFVVHEVPVSAFVAVNSPVCEGQPLTLNYTGNVIPGAVYTWYTPTNVYINPDGLTSYNVDYPGAGNYDIALKVTANGCSSDTTHVPMVVKPTPSAPFDATPNVCMGVDGYITFSGVTNPNYTYQWDFDGANVTAGSNQGPYVLNWTTPGIKDVTLIVTLDGCASDTNHVAVDVNTMPVSDFTASSPLCTGVDGTIFYTGNSITGATYAWDFNGATVTSGSGMGPYQLSWPDPGVKLLSLTVSANGCTSTTTQQAVIVNQTPVAQFSALDTNVCMGEPVTLLYTGNASPAATYNWYVTSGASISGSGSGPFTLDYTSAGNYFLTLTVTENGCVSQNNTTLPVTVTPLPQAYFTSPVGECLSTNSYDFLAQGSFTNNATFSWGFPGSNSIASSQLINPSGVSYGGAGIYLVSLSVSDLGCNAAFIDTVQVYPDPVVAFTSDVFRGCEDFQVQFTENSGYGADATYLWNFGDGNSSTDPNPLHIYNTPGQYTVSLEISFSAACGGTLSNSAMITVYPKPEAGFSATPLVTDMLNPNINVTNSAMDITACIYDMGDGNSIDSLLNPAYTYKKPGNFIITQYVTNTYGCTDTAWVQLRVDPYHTLYIPNAFTPNNDGKNDSFGAKGIMVENFKMMIFNRWGELLFVGENIDEYWNGVDKSGQMSPIDVYVYKVYYTLPDGSEQKQIGTVALVD